MAEAIGVWQLPIAGALISVEEEDVILFPNNALFWKSCVGANVR